MEIVGVPVEILSEEQKIALRDEQEKQAYENYQLNSEAADNGKLAQPEEQPQATPAAPKKVKAPRRSARPTRAKETTGAGKALTFDRKDADALEGSLAALGITARYNLRSMCAELSTGNGTWTRTDDRSSADLRRVIAGKFSYHLAGGKGIAPLRFGLDSWSEHLNALLHHLEVDPFLLWLEALPQWDGTKRLHRLLVDTFKAEENPLTSWASTSLCLGPIQRALEPGCKLDQVVVLIGAQGIGKSSLLSCLLPPTEPDWFSDSLSMTDDLKKRVESLQGRVIVELSDLQGFTKADMQSMKSFITRRDDGSVRLSFRRNPETALRRCILVGTSDRAECLPNDTAGNRRFVPVLCREGCNVEKFMAANREQLWAEALAIYRGGKTRAKLPRNLMLIQSERAESHRRSDELVEDVVGAIEGEGPYTMSELCGKASPAISSSDRRSVNRLADALHLAGWSKRHERLPNGKRAYLWRRGDEGRA